MIKKLLYSFIFLLLVLALLFSFMITTNLGLRFSLHTAALLSGNKIEIGKARGTILKGFSLRRIDFITPTYHIFAVKTDFAWQWHNILHGKLDIEHIQASTIFIKQVAESTSQSSDKNFSMPSLPIDLNIKQVQFKQIHLELLSRKPILIQSLNLSLYSQNNILYLTNLSILSSPCIFTSQGQISFNAPYATSFKNYFEYQYDKKQIIKLNNSIQGDANSLTFAITANHPYQAKLTGTIAHLLQNGTLAINGQWHDIKFYDDRNVKIFSSKGNLNLTGSLNHYIINLTAHLKSLQLPTFNTTLHGEGNLNSLQINALQVDTLGGQINVNGNVQWAPYTTWNLNILTNKINPGSYWNGWDSHINSQISVNGSSKEAASLNIQLQKLSGSLRGSSLSGTGTISKTDAQWTINHLKFQAGSNSININGTLGQQNHLQWKINLPNMRQINASANGSFISNGTLTGDIDNIQLASKTTARQFSFEQLKIAQLDSETNINEQNTYDIHIVGNNIQYGSLNISQWLINSQGTPAHHQLKMTLNSNFGMLFAHLNGRYEDQTWKSKLDQLTFQSKQHGLWKLNTPANIKLGKFYYLDNFNISNGTDHIALSGRYNPYSQYIDGKIDIQLSQLAWLEQVWDGWKNISGRFTIQGKVTGKAEQPNFNGNIALRNLNLLLPKFGIQVNNGNIQIQYNKQNTGQLNGSFLLNHSKINTTGSVSLNNNFSPSSISLTGKNVLVYNTSEYKVYADPNIQLSYEAPTLTISGQATIPKADITPKDFTSTVTLPSNVILISRDGEQQSNFNTALDIKINLGDDIRFKLSGLNAKIVGNLHILQSPEGLMLGQGLLKVSKGYYAAYNQRLNIQTGELMFTGNVISDPNLNILATKEIKLDPFSNPTIGSKLIVGVQVTGTMMKPIVNVYSNPPMDSNNALSFLLFGQGSDNLSNNKMQALQQTGSALGLTGDGLTDKLKQSLGLSELGVDSENLYDPDSQSYEEGAAVSVGKNLSKRLSITYSVGILVPDAILRVRYIISRHFAVQTEASSYDSGGDFLYTINTD